MPDDLDAGVAPEDAEKAPVEDDSQEPKAETQGKVRLEEIEEFKRYQSARDREKSELQRRIAQLTGELESTRTSEARLRQRIDDIDDPDEIARLEREVELEALLANQQAQLDFYEAEAKRAQDDRVWEDGWVALIERYGLSLTPALSGAITQARRNGYDDTIILDAIAKAKFDVDENETQSQREEERQQRADDVRQRQAEGAFTSLDGTSAIPPKPTEDVSYEDINKLYLELQESGLPKHEIERRFLELKQKAREAGHTA